MVNEFILLLLSFELKIEHNSNVFSLSSPGSARFTRTAEVPCELTASISLISKQMENGPWEFEGRMVDSTGQPTASASFVVCLEGKERE